MAVILRNCRYCLRFQFRLHNDLEWSSWQPFLFIRRVTAKYDVARNTQHVCDSRVCQSKHVQFLFEQEEDRDYCDPMLSVQPREVRAKGWD